MKTGTDKILMHSLNPSIGGTPERAAPLDSLKWNNAYGCREPEISYLRARIVFVPAGHTSFSLLPCHLTSSVITLLPKSRVFTFCSMRTFTSIFNMLLFSVPKGHSQALARQSTSGSRMGRKRGLLAVAHTLAAAPSLYHSGCPEGRNPWGI